jgi:hypothetical protein
MRTTALPISIAAVLLAATPAFANGTIEGTVRLAGAAPAVAAKPILKDANVCGRETAAESVVAGKAGALANVVVSVTDARLGARCRRPPARPSTSAAAATFRTSRR